MAGEGVIERAAWRLPVVELDRARDLVDVDLVELRGLTLQRLGRATEAGRALDQVVAATGARSDLRLGRR